MYKRQGNDPEEMGIRSSIALMLTLVGVAVLFDIEYILGAFLAGTLFAFTFPNRGSLENSLKGFPMDSSFQYSL